MKYTILLLTLFLFLNSKVNAAAAATTTATEDDSGFTPAPLPTVPSELLERYNSMSKLDLEMISEAGEHPCGRKASFVEKCAAAMVLADHERTAVELRSRAGEPEEDDGVIRLKARSRARRGKPTEDEGGF